MAVNHEISLLERARGKTTALFGYLLGPELGRVPNNSFDM